MWQFMFNSVRLVKKIPLLFSNFTQSDQKQEFFQLEIEIEKKSFIRGY